MNIISELFTTPIINMYMKTSKNLTLYRAAEGIAVRLPYADLGIKAGFPSPAQDYLTESIDLNSEIIKNPASTFLARVNGDSMKDAGIGDGDILIIDKSLEPESGKIAVCFIDGDFTIKRIEIEKDVIWLVPANENYEPIKVTQDNEFIIWGVVTHSLKSHLK